MNRDVAKEKRYHDKVAKQFAALRTYDYMWEIPEEKYLLRNEYFIGKRIVDMGCGPAVNIKRVLGDQILSKSIYTGIDISNEMLTIAKKNIPNGRFICVSMSKTNLPQKSIDTLLSCGALHHSIKQLPTLLHWTSLIKQNGYLLLREPLFEVLKKGEGASPIEEGIKINQILNLLNKEKFKIELVRYFTSPFFHITNRIMIKLLGNLWVTSKILWYPLMSIDIILCNSLGKYFKLFRGGAAIIIARKI